MLKEIKSWSYDPTKSLFKCRKSDLGAFYTAVCENPDSCPAYKDRKCILMSAVSGKCVCGRITRQPSPSQRSRKYDEFFERMKELHKDTYCNDIKCPAMISYIGNDSVYLPIPYIGLAAEKSNGEIQFLQGGGYFSSGNPIVSRSEFTPENIIKMIRMRPTAFFGGVITEYQEKSVPKFCKQLKYLDPDLFSKVTELMTQEERDRLENISDVGRNAVLSTLTPNIGTFTDIHGGVWTYDGEYLRSRNSHASFMLVSKFSEVIVRPDPSCTVAVTDDGQVNDKTEFID